jgi:uncharacterized lipoprotein YbaY
VILTKPAGQINAQVFIAGLEPFADAVLKLQVADCNEQDAPAKILAENSVALAARPDNGWAKVDVTIDWPERSGCDLSNMSLRAEIRSKKGDKLLYITKVSHQIDLAGTSTSSFRWTPTVVVQPV